MITCLYCRFELPIRLKRRDEVMKNMRIKRRSRTQKSANEKETSKRKKGG